MSTKKGRGPTRAGELVMEYLSEMPDASSRTIARLLRKNHPKQFASVEKARTTVRYYRGRCGKKDREKISDRRFVLPEPTPNNPFSLPQSEEKAWLPYPIGPDYDRILVMADIHVPFHNTNALNMALAAGKEYNPNCIILNGDIWDCYALSSFEKDPEIRNFPKEKEKAKHFLYALRNLFPDAKIIYKEGNHEYRFQRYLETKAPDFFGCPEFRIEVLLGLHDLDITYVADKRIITVGKLHVLHGHEWGRNVGSSVNPARTAFLRGKACALVSHNHQPSQHQEPTIEDKQISCWSTGCLSELHPQYMPINKWGYGFAFIEQYDADFFMVYNKRIVKGRVV